MTRRPRYSRLAAGTIVALATIASCGGSDDAEPAEVDDACTLLTATEIEAATGITVGSTTPGTGITASCDYDFAVDAWLSIQLTVSTGGFLHGEYVATEGSEPLDGIGAEAVYSPTYRVASVDLGDGRFVYLAVIGGYSALEDPRDELAELATLVADRL